MFILLSVVDQWTGHLDYFLAYANLVDVSLVSERTVAMYFVLQCQTDQRSVPSEQASHFSFSTTLALTLSFISIMNKSTVQFLVYFIYSEFTSFARRIYFSRLDMIFTLAEIFFHTKMQR